MNRCVRVQGMIMKNALTLPRRKAALLGRLLPEPKEHGAYGVAGANWGVQKRRASAAGVWSVLGFALVLLLCYLAVSGERWA